MTEEEQADASPEVEAETAAAPENQVPTEESNEAVNEPAEVSIRLDQFLQGCGVATGGQAKRMIQAGEVLVNEQIETRRKKKLVVGDEVTLENDIYVVALDDGSDTESLDEPE